MCVFTNTSALSHSFPLSFCLVGSGASSSLCLLKRESLCECAHPPCLTVIDAPRTHSQADFVCVCTVRARSRMTFKSPFSSTTPPPPLVRSDRYTINMVDRVRAAQATWEGVAWSSCGRGMLACAAQTANWLLHTEQKQDGGEGERKQRRVAKSRKLHKKLTSLGHAGVWKRRRTRTRLILEPWHVGGSRVQRHRKRQRGGADGFESETDDK